MDQAELPTPKIWHAAFSKLSMSSRSRSTQFEAHPDSSIRLLRSALTKPDGASSPSLWNSTPGQPALAQADIQAAVPTFE